MAAHLFVLWYAIASFITPPEGMAFFVAAAVAQAHPMRVGWRAVLLAIGNFVIPFVWIYNEGLVLEGSVSDTILAIVAAALGMTALSAGIEGFFLKRIDWIRRILLIASGTLIFFPNWWPRLAGTFVFVIVLSWLGVSRRKDALTTTIESAE
jgi:TRAP-type uncharacterized transport system fused permease subunit